MKPSNEPFLLKASFISFSLASAMIVSVFSASAEGYVTLEKDSGYATGFAGATWSETVDDPSTRDYLVANGKKLTTANAEVVRARSLTFGEVNGTKGLFFQYYSATFNNEGLVFANGAFYQHYANVTLAGKAKVSSPATAPFLFYNDYAKANDTVTFSGDFSSADGNCGIVVYAAANKEFTMALTGTSDNYLGSIVVTSNYDSAGAPYGTTLKVGTSSLPGSVDLRDGATLKIAATAELGALAISEGATLSLDAAHPLTVGKSLTIAEGVVVPLEITGLPTSVADVTRYPILIMPKDALCDEGCFSIANGSSDVQKRFDVAIVPYDADASKKVLQLTYYPVVSLVKKAGKKKTGDRDNPGASAMEDGTYWSDTKAVHSNAHYTVTKISGTGYLATPFSVDDPLAFPGRSLTFPADTGLYLQALDYTIGTTVFGTGLTYVYGMDAEDLALHGTYKVNGTLQVCGRAGASITLDGPLSGSSSALVMLSGESASTAQFRSTILLRGDHSGYAGKYRATVEYNRSYLDFTSHFVTVDISDGTNLGGPRSEFAFDAFKIDSLSRLLVSASLTLDEPTRGIFADDRVRIAVPDADSVFSVKEQLTVNARLYKEGAGMLALGGPLKFLDGESAPTDVVPADAALHTLYVTGGQLKPLAARSLDGLDIVFSNDVSKLDVGLTVDAATTDAELAQYGFIDLKTTENPLVASVKTGTVPVTFENLPQEDLKEEFSVPICTVRKAVAADILGVLVPAEKRVMLGNVKAKITLSASEPFTLDGFEAVTIKADVTPPAGMLLLVR